MEKRSWNPILPVIDVLLILTLFIYGTMGLKKLAFSLDSGGNDGIHPPSSNVKERKDEDIRNQIAHQKGLLEALSKRYRELEKEKAFLEKRAEESPSTIHSYQQIEAKNRALAEEIEKMKQELFAPPNPTISVERTSLVNIFTKRTPRYIALFKGTVAPVVEPFFHMKEEMVSPGMGKFEKVREFTFKRKGETLDQIFLKGSSFSEFLQEVKPREDYVALLVDPSSFDTFRMVRKVLKQNKIPFGWEPQLSTTIKQTVDGRVIGEEMD